MSAGGILGTGVDLVENDRMREVLVRWGDRLKSRVFLAEERAYCDSKASPWLYYAGRFAVKEAVSKALGTGIGPALSWLDIEVVRDPATGAPSVRFSGRGARFACSLGVEKVFVSLSHTRNFAVAHALLVGGRSENAQR